MKKCAVIIGVNKTARLPLLRASSDAAKFEQWAGGQQYDTQLITDSENPVTVSQIKEAITKFLNAPNGYDLMIIYFSGHGIWKAAGDEKWLLSAAAEDGNEAINVHASASLSRNSGIDHVVFISDACRTPTTDMRLTYVTGGVIFPTSLPGKRNSLDFLFSTNPGDASYEQKAQKESIQTAGIYTRCLLNGLSGNERTIISTIDIAGKINHVIQAYDLQDYLDSEIPKAIAKINVGYKQQPYGEITSRAPKHLAKFDKIDDSEITKEELPPAEEYMKLILPGNKMMRRFNVSRRRKDRLRLPIMANFLDFLKNRHLFVRETGFVITGLKNYSIIGDITAKYESGDSVILTSPNDPMHNYILIRLEDGTGVPLILMPDYIGVVIFRKDRIESLDYIPKSVFHLKSNLDIEMIIRRARIMQLLETRNFVVENYDMQSVKNASFSGMNQPYDPILGMHLAYSSAIAGDWQHVSSIYEEMTQLSSAIPFDIKMLKELFSPEKSRSDFTYSGFGPVITKGWSYLSIDYDRFPPHIRELAKHLVPGYWTQFTKKGTDFLETHQNEYEWQI